MKIINAGDIKGNAKVSILLFSEPGAGKTSSLKGTGRTLLISMESGELSLAGASNIDIVRVKTTNELKEAYTYIKENIEQYDTVAIDSLSELSEVIVGELKTLPEFQGMQNSIKLWGTYTERMIKIAKSFRDLDNINVVLIALAESTRSGYEEKMVPSVAAKKAQSKLPALYDEVIYINVNEDGNREFICQPTETILAKDRSGKLPPMVPYDKEKGLKPIFEMIKGE